MELLKPVHDFLGAATPSAWIDWALTDIDTLLIDHANCEKKAAGTAMNLLFRYNDREDLQVALAQLAREELLHYEQVRELIRARGIAWRPLSAARYAQGLRQHVRTHEPAHLVDLMLVGAFVEARSCERFAAIAPHLDEDLKRYYTFLLRSESRHFEMYLNLARQYAAPDDALDARIAFFREVEADLVTAPDSVLRFHSGPPA